MASVSRYYPSNNPLLACLLAGDGTHSLMFEPRRYSPLVRRREAAPLPMKLLRRLSPAWIEESSMAIAIGAQYVVLSGHCEI